MSAPPVTRARTASIRLLGGMQAEAGELPAVTPKTGRVAALLALLALEAGHVVSAERLMNQLWEDGPPESGLAALYVYVSRLRRQLAPLRIAVETRSPGYVLDVAPGAIDIVLFAEAVGAAESALDENDLDGAKEHLRGAHGHWRGDPFQGASSCPDLVLESQRLQRLRDRLTELDARFLLASGQARAAADLARTLTERDPLSEAHWALRIESEHGAGNTAVALGLYEEFRELLAETLGIDPGARLRNLHTAVLRDDRTQSTASSAAAEPAAEGANADIGRVAHLQEIRTAIAEASRSRGHVLVLEGHAGVGKTYLAERAAQLAEQAGMITAWTRTVEGTGAPPLWPWQRVLAALPGAKDPTGVDDLAILQSAANTVAEPDEARFRLAEALVGRVLAAARQTPLLLVFDDLQWADAATLHAVGVLSSAVRASACVVILTVRQPVAHRPALASALASLQRETTARRLPVSEFTLSEITTEVQRVTGFADDQAAALAVRLRERTGGNAFFFTELLAAGADDSLPSSVSELVQERLAPLDFSLRRIVDSAAVAGLAVDVPLLAGALATAPQQVMTAADELCRAGIWRGDGSGYAFAHSLARDAVLASMPRATAVTAHRQLAEALEARHSADLDPALEAIAYHRFRAAAGMSDEDAYLACTAAADRARRSLAFDQAATFRERAVAVIPADDEQPRRRATSLLALTAERRAAGDVVAAASALRQAIRAAQKLGETALTVQVLSLLGESTLWNWRQYGEVDHDTIDLLDDLLGDRSLTESERTDLSVALAMELYYADEPARSRAGGLAQAAVAASARTDDPGLRSRAFSALVFSVWRPNSESARLSVLDEWLSAAAPAAGGPGEIVARLHRASIHLVHGDLDAWSIDIERAGELLTRAGRAEYSAQYTAQLAGAALQAGRLDEARALMDRTDATMRRTSMWGGTWVSWMQRLTLARLEGRVPEIADDLLAAAAPDGQRSLRWAAVLALSEAGRVDEARAMQGRWNLRTIPRTSTWSTDFDIAQAAEVAVHLGTPLLSDAYERLARSHSPLLMAGTGIAVIGPRGELLARIADRLGRDAEAAEHRARGREVHRTVQIALGNAPSWPLAPASSDA